MKRIPFPVLFLRAEGLVIFGAATFAFRALAGTWPMFFLLILLPDISLIGYVFNSRVGAAVYNVGHALIVPLLLLLWCVMFQNFLRVLIALVWIAHIGLDRFLGFGLKHLSGFKDTDLGTLKMRS